jgi:hypothetical protein
VQQTGAPVDVELQAVRGAAEHPAVPAGHALHLKLDSRDIPQAATYPIEIVDSAGAKTWTGTGVRTSDGITATVPLAFPAGTYYVRLLKEGNQSQREFELVIR